MIVAAEPAAGSGEAALRIVTQTDHAAFSGELLSLWRADGLPDHPRRGDLVFAAREHDNGWRESDSAPSCRADGRPHDFLSMPDAQRREIWHRGTRRFVDERPYGALLIVEHALQLHRRHDDSDPEWHEALASWRELRDELQEATGTGDGRLAHDYRWVALADTLSLAVCARWRDPFDVDGRRATLEHHEPGPPGADLPVSTLHLDPFPLAGATSFTLRHRVVPERSYRGDADLGTELALARWHTARIRVAPG